MNKLNFDALLVRRTVIAVLRVVAALVIGAAEMVVEAYETPTLRGAAGIYEY